MKNICTISREFSVLKAMAKMEAQGARWACVIDSNSRVLGVITHGDIRRYILDGGSLESSCVGASNQDFFSLSKGVSPTEVARALESFDFIPILDPNNGSLVDVATTKGLHTIPILEPNLGELELSKLNETFLSGWISSKSPTVSAFEKGLESATGLNNLIAVSNGTVAIHLALEALGIRAGDEVIVPDLTFAATVNAVIHSGATPVLVDVEGQSLGLDFELMSASVTKKTKAVILVHLYGMAARDYERIALYCEQNKIFLIEDCAEALGTTSNGKHVGHLGDAATFSFFGNKLITTGEGGAVAFRSLQVMEHARILRDHGQSTSKRYQHDFVGFNYRITGLQAAIGIGQLERIEDLLQKKKTIAHGYRNRIPESEVLEWLDELEVGSSSFWLNVLVIRGDTLGAVSPAEFIIEEVAKVGIELRPLFKPMHEMAPYKDFKFSKNSSQSKSSLFYRNAFCLPSGTTLTPQDVRVVSDELTSAIQRLSMGKLSV